jgi:hypothetical protein
MGLIQSSSEAAIQPLKALALLWIESGKLPLVA